MKSIIQDKKECYVCKTTYALQEHHCLYGSHRSKSEEDGLKVYLCLTHHTGERGVHSNNGYELDIMLRQIAQRKYEENHTREEFIKRYRKSYLEE